MAKKKSVKSNSGLNDERFSRIKSDPMFSGLKSSDKKVVIDKRFAAALTDERFSTRAKVDMRGRKQKKTVGNNMLDLYELEEDEDDQQKTKKSTEKKLKNKKKKVEEDDKELDEFFDENDDEEEEVDDEEDADDEEEEVTDNEEVDDEKKKTVGLNGFKKLDLARGEGNVDSSSDDDSSDEEGDELDEHEQGIELDLANLDRDVDQVEWTSKRLAVCNLEWDQMNCEDILMLVKSFTPQEGSVVSVGIYLSDFGKEEQEKEEKTGPALKLAKPVEEYKEDEMDDETRTAVREYLVNKLKHYYAVITFDSVPSAVAVYEECDGFQFEETGLKMDMRFIPDDMEFEEDRIKEFLNAEDVNMAKYKAKKKSKSAIISTGAKIAWDEDDPSRKKKFLEAFNGDEEAGKDLIVDSDDSDDDESNRNKLMALLHTDERQSKLDVDWEGEEKDDDDDGSDSSDGEYVKVDDDDDEIGIKNKKKDLDDEEEDVETKQEEEKLTGYKAYKKKQKAKLMENKLKRKGTAAGEAVANIKTVAAAETIASDDRFSALFTDSAFAIEPSSKKFKGSLLVSKQAEQKLKGSSTTSNESKPSSQPEDLVQKLKKQADKWNKKKSAPKS